MTSGRSFTDPRAHPAIAGRAGRACRISQPSVAVEVAALPSLIQIRARMLAAMQTRRLLRQQPNLAAPSRPLVSGDAIAERTGACEAAQSGDDFVPLPIRRPGDRPGTG
jgi:hypothetical protein